LQLQDGQILTALVDIHLLGHTRKGRGMFACGRQPDGAGSEIMFHAMATGAFDGIGNARCISQNMRALPIQAGKIWMIEK
jgi:hypothetical protein